VRKAVLIAWIAVGVMALLMFQLPAITLPANSLGLRRFQTPAVSPDMQFAQTFEMNANGLRAVEFYPALTDAPMVGNIKLALVDITERQEQIVGTALLSTSMVGQAPVYRFEFPVLENSLNHRYRLEVASDSPSSAASADESATGDPSRGLALWATKGDSYERGAMFANGRERWADLAFRTVAPTSSVWEVFSTPSSPAGGLRRALLLGALVLDWLTVGLLLHLMSRLWLTRHPSNGSTPSDL
jgi:hypothetical protein